MQRLRVYLSSTFEDLKDYRVAAFEAMEKAGLDVARMEAYASADARPLDLCLSDVARSDIYVGLFAWRYGYEPLAEHGNPAAKSITELEYRRAEGAGLRKLVFFAHADTKATWPDRFKDDVTGEGDAGAKIRALRTELGVEKTASFFRTPGELATLILAAIMRSGLSGRFYNVPPRPPGFVPRTALTNAIVEALIGGAAEGSGGSHTMVQGAGGFGKTTLAIDACHQPEVLRAFSDGILWVALGQAPDLVRKLSDLYATATGTAPAVAGMDAISEALSKVLEAKQSLIVVDDVWRAEDLAPLITLRGPRLLVTTRIRNLIEQSGQTGWREVAIDEMEPGEAVALIGRGLVLDDAARTRLREVAGLLGCWPLLLELASARLLEEHKTRSGSAAEAIERVPLLFERRGVFGFDRRDSNARNAAVARSLDVGLESAELMSKGLTLKAAEIAVFPEDLPIPTQVLADLWRMDELDVEEEVLRPLDNLSIVAWDRTVNRVHVHDAIRRALAARLPETASVHRRLVDAWRDPYHLPHAYAWTWYGWHCARAEDQPRLEKLLLDVPWLQAKLEATDINAVVQEYDHVDRKPTTILLQSTLLLSAHVLARRKSALAEQLLGRLPEQQVELRDQVLAAMASRHDAWLRPLRPGLTPPGGPLVRTLESGAGKLQAVALTNDGRRAVSGSEDGTLKVWDLERGRELRVFKAAWGVSAVAITPDGKTVVSTSKRSLITAWDLEASERVDGNLRASAVVLSPDGTRAIAATHDGALELWDLEHGRRLSSIQAQPDVTAIAATPDGKRAATATRDWSVTVWDLESGAALHTLTGQVKRVTALALGANGERVVTATYDGTLRSWDFERSNEPVVLKGHAGEVHAVALTSDGKLAVSASHDGTLKVWDLERATEVRTLEGHSSAVTAVALTLDGTRAVSASKDGTFKFWDLAREALASFKPHEDKVAAISIAEDGRRAVSASADGTLQVWDLGGCEVVRTLTAPAGVSVVGLSADGTRAIASSWTGRATLWNLESSAAPRELEFQRFDPLAVALTSDGQRAVFVFKEGAITIQQLGEPRGRSVEAHSVEFKLAAAVLTPDGKRALIANPKGVLEVWDETTAKGATLVGTGKPIQPIALTPDGTRAAAVDWHGTLTYWDASRGDVLRTLEVGADAVAIALQPNGKCAISAGTEITLWDLATGECQANFSTDTALTSVALTRDSRVIIAGDIEGRINFLRLENAPEQ